MNPQNKHQPTKQPTYDEKPSKIEARRQIISIYRYLTGQQSIPKEKGYWTLCNEQSHKEGAEIVQLVNSGLIQKNQFFGIDFDALNQGIIENNQKRHPEANWFKGDWLEVIEENYEIFNPGLIYFDHTQTIVSLECRLQLAKTMNMCPSGTVIAANMGLADGHSSRRFDPDQLIKQLWIHLRSPKDWTPYNKFYSYKCSYTEFGTYIFVRK